MTLRYNRGPDRADAGNRETPAGFGQTPIRRDQAESRTGWGNGRGPFKAPPEPIANAPQADNRPFAPARTKGDYLVLVIDRQTADLTADQLTQREGYRTAHAFSIDGADGIIETEKPKVIVIGAATLGFGPNDNPRGHPWLGSIVPRLKKEGARLIIIDGSFDSGREAAFLGAGVDRVIRRDEQHAGLGPAVNRLMPVRFIETTGRTVLVMTEDPDVTGLFRTVMEGAGYEVRTAATHGEVVEKAVSADLVLLDQGWNGEGVGAIASIKAARPDMPFFLRAYGLLADSELIIRNVVVLSGLVRPQELLNSLRTQLPLPEAAGGGKPEARQAAADTAAEWQPASQAKAAPAKKQATVLIVDDARGVSEAWTIVLRRNGYTALAATDGREGLEAYRAKPVDLVISDRDMPKMDGVEMARAIKQINPAAKIIFVTGQESEEKIRELEATGPVAILKKPVDPAALVAEVGRALGG